MSLRFSIKVDDNGNPTVIRLGKNISKLGNQANRVGDIFKGTLSAQALTSGLKVASRIVSDLGGKFVSFEKEMSTVKAIVAKNTGEFKALGDQAKRLGQSTAFSATQSAQAFVSLGRLGLQTNEIIASSAGVLNLAAAAGAEMSRAAEVGTSTLRIFNLSATGMGRVVDVMAKSFSSTALDMEKFAESIKVAGPVAKATGVDLEQTAAAIGVLANNGIQGSMAGTSLRRILLELGNETSNVSKALGGASLKTHSLAQLFQMMQEKGFGVVEMEKNFGKIAVSSAITMARQAEQMKILSDEFDNASGSGKKMADIMIDNVDGALTLLASASEGLVISFSEAFGSTTKDLIDSVSKFISERLTPNTERMRELLMGTSLVIGAIAAAFTGVIAITKTYAGTVALISFVSKAYLLASSRVIAVKSAIQGATFATKAWALAQRVFNSILQANPMGLLASILTGLVVTIIPSVILGFDKFKEILVGIGKVAKAVGTIILGAVTFDSGRISSGFSEFKKVAGETFANVAEEAKRLGIKLMENLGFVSRPMSLEEGVVNSNLPALSPALPASSEGNSGSPLLSPESAAETQRLINDLRIEAMEEGIERERAILENWAKSKEEKAKGNSEALLLIEEVRRKKMLAIEQKFQKREAELHQRRVMAAFQLAGAIASTMGVVVAAAKGSAVQQKRIAQVSALIDALAGANRAYSQGGIFGVASAALILTKGLANVALIEQQKFAQGGVVQGFGGPTSDTVPVLASPGERVLSVAQVGQLGGNDHLDQLIEAGSLGGGGINLTVNGNIVGEDAWVRDSLLPAIKSELERR